MKDDSVDVVERCPRVNLVVGDAVLPSVAKESLGLVWGWNYFQTIDFPTVQSSRLTCVKSGRENQASEDWGFDSHVETVIAEDPCALVRK